MNRPISNQPQVDPTVTIYGSKKRPPLDSANQPEVIPNKVYGAKVLPTIRVRLKDSDDNRELIINADSYDPDIYEKLK